MINHNIASIDRQHYITSYPHKRKNGTDNFFSGSKQFQFGEQTYVTSNIN